MLQEGVPDVETNEETKEIPQPKSPHPGGSSVSFARKQQSQTLDGRANSRFTREIASMDFSRNVRPRCNVTSANKDKEGRKTATHQHEQFSHTRVKQMLKESNAYPCSPNESKIPSIRHQAFTRICSAPQSKTNHMLIHVKDNNEMKKNLQNLSVPSKTKQVPSNSTQTPTMNREMTFLLTRLSRPKSPKSRSQTCLNPRHASARPRLSGNSSAKVMKGNHSVGERFFVRSARKENAQGPDSQLVSALSPESQISSGPPTISSSWSSRRALYRAPTVTRRVWSQPLPKSAKQPVTLPSSRAGTAISKSDHVSRLQTLNTQNQPPSRAEKGTIGDFLAKAELRKSSPKLTFNAQGNFRTRFTRQNDVDAPKKAVSDNTWCIQKMIQRDKSRTIKKGTRSTTENFFKLTREKTFELPRSFLKNLTDANMKTPL